MFQAKYDKTQGKNPNEMEINNVTNKEFKVIKMLTELKRKINIVRTSTKS